LELLSGNTYQADTHACDRIHGWENKIKLRLYWKAWNPVC
jgi:hypothetical protein